VPWLFLIPPIELGDQGWGQRVSVGIVLATAPIWLPFVYRLRDNEVLPPGGKGFRWIVMLSTLLSTLGLVMVFWDPIDRYLEAKAQNDATKKMASIAASVSDQPYFNSLVDSFRDGLPNINKELEKHSLSFSEMEIGLERHPDGMYTIRLSGDTITCNGLFSEYSRYQYRAGMYDPSSFELGSSADHESSLLMTRVLALLSPQRAAHVDQIVYAAHFIMKNSPITYEAALKPGDFASHKSTYAELGDFVKANKSILRDTFSGWKCDVNLLDGSRLNTPARR
jgi:hypothetical protein